MLFLFTILLYTFVNGQYRPGPDAMKMSDLKALTLYPNKMTTGRRLSPLPQLVCTGGSGREYANKITSTQCVNKGFDGKEYQWRCEAKLDRAVKFGKFYVSCEGYRDSRDEWILVGSCNLNYQLELKDLPQPEKKDVPLSQDIGDTLNVLTVVFFLWFIFVLLVCVCCCSGNSNSNRSLNIDPIPKATPIYTPRTNTIVEEIKPSVSTGTYNRYGPKITPIFATIKEKTKEPSISNNTYNTYSNSYTNYYSASTNLWDDDSDSSSDDFGFGGTSNR